MAKFSTTIESPNYKPLAEEEEGWPLEDVFQGWGEAFQDGGHSELVTVSLAFDQLNIITPLLEAYNSLPKTELNRLNAMEPPDACMALLQVVAHGQGKVRTERTLRLFAAREGALREAGGMIGPSQLAQYLGKSRQTIKDWGDANKILWVDDNGTRLYPLCQFDSHGQILRGLDQFLHTLAAIGITGWMALDMLLGVDPKFQKSPLELLQGARIDDAVTCALALSDAGAA